MKKYQIHGKMTKKDEFIALEINNLKQDPAFMLLEESIQNEVIANLQKVSKHRNDAITKYFTYDQLIIYVVFASLVVFLILNVFLKYINIPFMIYLFFFVVIIGTFFFIVLSKRKMRIKEIWNMVSSWDEIPKPARNDFVEIVKNEIEASHLSMIGRIMYGKYMKYLIYLLLSYFILQTFLQDKSMSFRFFLVTSLSIMTIFIMMIPVSIIDKISGDKKITHKDFLCVYLLSLNSSYKKLIFTMISFLAFMVSYGLYNGICTLL